ncbi:MAG: hypothetical protein V4616_07035 [Bacteroidota bacterium]
MIKNSLTILLLSICLCSYSQRRENLYAYFGNLEGTWKLATNNDASYEEWKIVNDTLAEGGIWKNSKGQKIQVEKLRIVLKNGDFLYERSRIGQKENLPITYKAERIFTTKEMVSGKEAHAQVSMVFINASHDYPQYIRYTIKPGSLVVKAGNDGSMKEGASYSYGR